jgi:hypothetical protein
LHRLAAPFPKTVARRNPAEAVKLHLVSGAGGETDLMLDGFVNALDAATRATADVTPSPGLNALAKPKG